jgi:hypothetical protein
VRDASCYKAPVARFFSGFLTASLVWGGLLFASARGYIDLGLTPAPEPEPLASVAVDDDSAQAAQDKGKRRRGGGTKKRTLRSGDSSSGDDLGENDPRSLDVGASGGEEQLTGSEIERGFDGVFSQVRRCLILAASDDPVRGKVTFGLRVSGGGNVTAVNLNGPSSVTQGECGACLRKAAMSIRFRAFRGPDMIVHYPLTLE